MPDTPLTGNITLPVEDFEQLLAALANQKFVGEAPPNGDALDMGKEKYDATQKSTQELIDEIYVKNQKRLSEFNRQTQSEI